MQMRSAGEGRTRGSAGRREKGLAQTQEATHSRACVPEITKCTAGTLGGVSALRKQAGWARAVTIKICTTAKIVDNMKNIADRPLKQ